jgi:hypothetical protein
MGVYGARRAGALLPMRVATLCLCGLVLQAPAVAPAYAQGGELVTGQPASTFNVEQLDALLAPIALYPDSLLTQMLMASVYPVEIVQAARWLEDPANKDLTGDALVKALESQNWDPSVKSLVAFPQVLQMMNEQLDWTQQLGYAFAAQQADVMASIQRLRRQAQAAGTLASTPQQTVSAQGETVVIEPVNPQIVYVPSYNPTVVYGSWPYPAYPPVYWPPPPGYVAGTALAAGLAFGAGVAITAGLWGWARPAWNAGYVNVNVNRYNSINVNRTRISSNVWRPTATPYRAGAGARAPAGPVGAPARLNGMPANAVGRQSVRVPQSLVGTPGQRRPPDILRPPPTPARQPSRPAAPVARPLPAAGTAQRGNAFSDIGQGRQAGQFAGRGQQSRTLGQAGRPNVGAGASAPRGGAPRGGGFRR